MFYKLVYLIVKLQINFRRLCESKGSLENTSSPLPNVILGHIYSLWSSGGKEMKALQQKGHLCSS